MKFKADFLYLFLGLLLLTAGCKKENNEPDGSQELITIQGGQKVPVSALIPGVMRVQVSEELASKLESQAGSNGVIVSSNVKSVDETILSIGVKSMKRTFPYAGKFEKRTRECGLHLWYDVYFDENQLLTKADETLSSIDGIESVEYRPKIIKHFSDEATEIKSSRRSASQSAVSIFDDPQFSGQWHLYNDGFSEGCKAGCDVKILPSWTKFSTGNPDVIVSVVDGGIDFRHEDLSSNMWLNPEESGDNRYGFNFLTNTPVLTYDSHGTHVAGIISAVNNNGVGVCGIAGGNSQKNQKGVRLMSCQIFEGEEAAEGAVAIKWGADHGAVISQNSWGYDGAAWTPPSDIAAINYFIKCAGMGEDGVTQTGPMAGGIVVFAAGNDNVSMAYPGGDLNIDGLILVSALAGDYVKAYYSNYGSWVSIAAPGGDKYKNCLILSTLPNNSYGGMQGTSMACPVVSGTIALAVSYFAKQGLTNTYILDRILNHTTDIYDKNPDYQGKLGRGLVNSFASLNVHYPDPVEDFSISTSRNSIHFKALIPEDEDDGTPYALNVYYDTKPFDDISSVKYQSFLIPDDLTAGDYLEGTVESLLYETTYYIGICSVDEAGNVSSLSSIKSIKTPENKPPVILKEIENVLFSRKDDNPQVIDLQNYFSDDDMQQLVYTVESVDPNVLNTYVVNGHLYLTPVSYGYSDVKVTATDIMDKFVSSTFKVLVRDSSQEIDVYPNPVRTMLYIRTSVDASARITLVNSSGSTVSNSDVSISPFLPAQIDMTSFSGGTYTLLVEIGEKVIKKNVVKL